MPPSVLLVEDEFIVAQVTADILERQNLAVSIVHCAADALAALERNAGYDLMITDIMMPGGMTGVELAEIVRDQRPAMEVIITTGYSGDASVAAAKGFEVLLKPYAAEVLASRVFDKLARGRQASG